jgi:hypothetical protein
MSHVGVSFSLSQGESPSFTGFLEGPRSDQTARHQYQQYHLDHTDVPDATTRLT